MKAFALALFCLAAVGCVASSQPDDLYVYVQDPDARVVAQEAAAAWRECGGRQVWVVGIQTGEAVELRVVDEDDAALEGHPGVTVYDGDGWSSATTRIEVRRDAVEHTTGHEIGHALRQDLGHYAGGVMSHGERPTLPNEVDCEALRDRW